MVRLDIQPSGYKGFYRASGLPASAQVNVIVKGPSGLGHPLYIEFRDLAALGSTMRNSKGSVPINVSRIA